MMHLRPKQQSAILWLENQILRGGHREVGLSAQPGFGKSIVQQVLATRLLDSGAVRLTVSLAPQIQIKSSLMPLGSDNLWGFSDSTTTQVNPCNWFCPDKRTLLTSRETLQQALRAERPNIKHLVLTYQAVLTWLEQDKDDSLFSGPLHNVLWFFDEGHHASDDNLIGSQIANEIRKSGGLICFMSATMYRHTGEISFDTTTTPVYTVSMTEAMSEPDDLRYCPKEVEVKTLFVGKTDVSSQSTCDFVANQWDLDGRPKSVIILPRGNSEGLAESTINALKAKCPNLRVLNTVGKDKVAITKSTLDTERRVTYCDSQIDVVVACARFDEGTDWPLCSSVYCLDPTNSLGKTVQRIGRAMRNKRGISDYPEAWKDRSAYTLIIGPTGPQNEEEQTLLHTERAFLTAAVMDNCKTAWDYLRDDFTKVINSIRPRSGKENISDWETASQMMGCCLEEAKQVVGLVAEAKAQLQLVDGLKPEKCTVGEIESKLRAIEQAGKSAWAKEKWSQIQVCLTDMVYQTLPNVVRCKIRRRMRKELKQRFPEARREDWRWVREEMQRFFADVAKELRDESVTALDMSPGSEIMNFVTSITGKSAEAISQELIAKLPWEYRFTKLKNLVAQKGRAHFNWNDPEEKTLGFWLESQRDQHRRNDLASERVQALAGLGVDLVRSSSVSDVMAELIRRCQADRDWVPCSHNAPEFRDILYQLRVQGTEAQRIRLTSEVPWFTWDYPTAEFKGQLQVWGRSILDPNNPAYLQYQVHHRRYRVGLMPSEMSAVLEANGLDDQYHEVYQGVFNAQVESATSFNEILTPELRRHLMQDDLLAFERDVVFTHPLFVPFKTQILARDEKTWARLLEGKTEESIHPRSLVGLWWETLSEQQKFRYRMEKLCG